MIIFYSILLVMLLVGAVHSWFNEPHAGAHLVPIYALAILGTIWLLVSAW